MLERLKSLFAGNRRKFDRDPVDSAATLMLDGRSLACQISDVSPSGAFLTPLLDVPTGKEGTLCIPTIAIDTPVRVVRLTDRGVGIEFMRDNVGAIVAGWTKGRTAG